jgi:hypothetical protein
MHKRALWQKSRYDKELMIIKEMTMSNAVMLDVLTSLLLEKGVFAEKEFTKRFKEVQEEYDAGKRQ